MRITSTVYCGDHCKGHTTVTEHPDVLSDVPALPVLLVDETTGTRILWEDSED